ncbi:MULTISPECIES: hypothetical protein [Bradyrhizobium]|uniref:hypothetical protein n=1 Tax=Bradyrhizobium elkanii TaxID=29448 RepID=UPI0004001ABE|nr:hypothetical protein [Bradyrhizobium elkanii]
MDAPRFLHFLFASLISIGLAIAPFAGSAAAVHAASDVGMAQMADMSGDMPCCPEKQKQNDCQDCPLLAICMAKVMRIEPSNDLPVHLASSRTLRPLDEPAVASLMRPPPDHPPRTIV